METFDTFQNLNNWHVFNGPRPGVPNGFDCVNNYLTCSTDGLSARADVIGTNKNGWRIASKAPLTFPCTVAARILLNGPTPGGLDVEGLISSFYFYTDESQPSYQSGLPYYESDFEFCLASMDHPLLYWYGVRGMHSGPALLNSVYYAGAKAQPDAYPCIQTFVAVTGNMMNAFVTCIIRVAKLCTVLSTGEIIYKTTFEMVCADGSVQVLATRVTKHAPCVSGATLYLDQHWQDVHAMCTDPVQVQKGIPQTMQVKWCYISSDPNTKTVYDLHRLEDVY